MKLDQDVRNAISLKAEYDRIKPYATREGAPKVELNYYSKMLERVSSQIDWRLLETRKKEEKVDIY